MSSELEFQKLLQNTNWIHAYEKNESEETSDNNEKKWLRKSLEHPWGWVEDELGEDGGEEEEWDEDVALHILPLAVNQDDAGVIVVKPSDTWANTRYWIIWHLYFELKRNLAIELTNQQTFYQEAIIFNWYAL